jgi:bacterial leucyl aminopeptidase
MAASGERLTRFLSILRLVCWWLPIIRRFDLPGSKVVFFDLGDTLGTPRLSAAGVLDGFDVFPFVPEVLTKMKATGPAGFAARLGVISNTPPAATVTSMASVLSASGILAFFEPGLLLYSSVEGIDKTKKAFFTLAATRAALATNRCVFVGESDAERTVAKSAGLLSAFHPLHAFKVLSTLP